VFPWIADRVGVDERSLDEFKTCIRELFNNIQDHSTEEIGCMHVQKYPNARRVKIAVSDFGIGIPTEVRKVKPSATDPHALYLAAQEGFTSKPGGRNMGAGLSYLTDNVVSRNRGEVSIYSGSGEIHFHAVPNGAKRQRVALSRGFYPGTLVSMTLRTDTIGPPEMMEGVMPWE
jgi:anti-sigma regulatory factor (Ser/Thr protein kinase)